MSHNAPIWITTLKTSLVDCFLIWHLETSPGRPRNKWLDQIHSDNNLHLLIYGDVPVPSVVVILGDATVPTDYAVMTTIKLKTSPVDK